MVSLGCTIDQWPYNGDWKGYDAESDNLNDMLEHKLTEWFIKPVIR